MQMLLKPRIKVALLFLAFGLAAQALLGMLNMVVPALLAIVALSLIVGLVFSLTEADKGMMIGFREGVILLPKLICTVIWKVTTFVFSFVSRLV